MLAHGAKSESGKDGTGQSSALGAGSDSQGHWGLNDFVEERVALQTGKDVDNVDNGRRSLHHCFFVRGEADVVTETLEGRDAQVEIV